MVERAKNQSRAVARGSTAPRAIPLAETRGQQAKFDLGDFYVHDFHNNCALETGVNPATFWEEMAADV